MHLSRPVSPEMPSPLMTAGIRYLFLTLSTRELYQSDTPPREASMAGMRVGIGFYDILYDIREEVCFRLESAAKSRHWQSTS